MAQRLILTAKEGLIPVYELQAFAETAVLHGVRMNKATYDLDKDGQLRIMLTLPKDVRVVGKRVVRVKPKTGKAKAVEKQIDEHRERKKNGESDGYVPPVGRKTAPKPQKIKCPVCDTKKQIVKVSGQRMVKPHVSKGEPCPGSGAQVINQGRGKPLVAEAPASASKKKKRVKEK